MAAAPLYGLVLVGGKSRRMGQDKAWLSYHGKPQILYLFELLQSCCAKTYLSCLPGQRDQDLRLQGLPSIHDQIIDIGPISGIFSAGVRHPLAAWLVIACDLPMVKPESLHYLIEQRDPTQLATCFTSEDNEEYPEPLCTIYEPSCQEYIRLAIANGSRSPAKVLLHEAARTKLLRQPVPQLLKNVNNSDDFFAVTKKLSGADNLTKAHDSI